MIMKSIYVIRHCEAEGQPPDAQLTQLGYKQAEDLTEIFIDTNVERIISSPYKRAIQSIYPLAEQLGIEIERDQRLAERVLTTKNIANWQIKLKATFHNLDLKFSGG